MAKDEERSQGTHAAAVSLAHGRTEHTAAKGAQAGDRIEHDLAAESGRTVDFYALLW